MHQLLQISIAQKAQGVVLAVLHRRGGRLQGNQVKRYLGLLPQVVLQSLQHHLLFGDSLHVNVETAAALDQLSVYQFDCIVQQIDVSVADDIDAAQSGDMAA